MMDSVRDDASSVLIRHHSNESPFEREPNEIRGTKVGLEGWPGSKLPGRDDKKQHSLCRRLLVESKGSADATGGTRISRETKRKQAMRACRANSCLRLTESQCGSQLFNCSSYLLLELFFSMLMSLDACVTSKSEGASLTFSAQPGEVTVTS